jgi:hypothetical protein
MCVILHKNAATISVRIISFLNTRYLRVPDDALLAMDPFLNWLESAKEAKHNVAGHALLRSLPGCKKQDAHTDYYTMRSHGMVRTLTAPYSCVVALEEGSSFYINDVKIALDKGNAIILRGDVVHSGSEYKFDNIRYHIYIDVAGEHVANEGTHVHWCNVKSK